MKKLFFAAIILFLGLGSAILFLEQSQTYTNMADVDPTEIPEATIVTKPTGMDTIISVKMETTMGEVMLEIYPDKAPETVSNFLHYTNSGAYEGTIFHRVIKDFMNQGGGFNTDYEQTETQAPIPNEAFNGLKNLSGTIAMARTRSPHSATKQFFINTADNSFLDHTEKSLNGWGYAVFGKVISGMDVMQKIANVQTGAHQPFAQNVPIEQIIITKMSEVKSSTDSANKEPLAAE